MRRRSSWTNVGIILAAIAVVSLVSLVTVWMGMAPARPETSTAVQRQDRDADRKAEAERFAAEVEKLLGPQKCGTSLYLRKLGLFNEWVIQCADCGAGLGGDLGASVSVSAIWPQVMIDRIEAFAVDGRLPMTTFLRSAGQC